MTEASRPESAPAEAELRFADLQLPAPLLSALAEVGYETPSPIQAACIPQLLAGHDILGEAQTGTSGGALARDVGSQADMKTVTDPDGETRATKQDDINAGVAYDSDRRGSNG